METTSPSAALPHRRRLAVILAVLHGVAVIVLLASKPFVPYPTPVEQQHLMSLNAWNLLGDMIAARYFHFAYEPLYSQALTLLDLPALLLGGLTLNRIAAKTMNPFEASYVFAAVWVCFGSAQWYFIGRAIEHALTRKRA